MSQSIVSSSAQAITRRIIRSFRTSKLYSETEKKKWIMFGNGILKSLGDSVAKPTKQFAPDHTHYSDSVDADSIQLPEDNDPFMSNFAYVF